MQFRRVDVRRRGHGTPDQCDDGGDGGIAEALADEFGADVAGGAGDDEFHLGFVLYFWGEGRG